MSLEKAKQYLESKGFLDHIIEPDVTTSTVAEAAAGNDHSAVKLTLPELEQACEAKGWVDVCKEPQA